MKIVKKTKLTRKDLINIFDYLNSYIKRYESYYLSDDIQEKLFTRNRRQITFHIGNIEFRLNRIPH